jgi:hypothetical protein
VQWLVRLLKAHAIGSTRRGRRIVREARAIMTDDTRPPGHCLIDFREGDVEDDASSPEKRSMLAIAGSLIAEISLPKLALAWIVMIVLPGLAIGMAPLIFTAWARTTSTMLGALAGLGPLLLLATFTAVAAFGARPLLRLVEKSFWSLNSLAVQPGYALCREALRHLVERFFLRAATAGQRARANAGIAAAAGLVASLGALGVLALAWPHTRWTAQMADLAAPLGLIGPAAANALAVVSVMLAGASLIWGIADAAMDQPRDLEAFEEPVVGEPVWRVAHLSDVHVVGERHGLRIESGRAGPSGNHRFVAVLDRLAAIHARSPLELIVFSGDMTDAGRCSEWLEFQRALARHPELSACALILPGNHDLNIVDRANPARLDLPTSPFKRLRQIRTLSAMAALQGDRVRVLSSDRASLGPTLNEALAPHAEDIATFADRAPLRLMLPLQKLWADVFPMVLPPRREDGLGVILLNSNAETHFSFTNALGLVTGEQAEGIATVARQFPSARWIVALHHHMVEYPRPAKALSERIGTALINGSWFVRKMKPLASRIVTMHGHRHIDWIGACGPLRIVSAPSPVMGGRDDEETHFHIHRLSASAEGGLLLLEPETVRIERDGPPLPLS